MNEGISKPKKKFKGFTQIFQNQTKKNVKKEPKKPFTGFSEFYKKLKDHEVYDEYDDYDSLYDPFTPRREIPKPVEKIEEPPPPPDKHFKPRKYFEWCKERSKEAFDRYAEEEGDVSYNEEGAEIEKAGSIRANSLVNGIKRSAGYRKYDNYRKPYDQSTLDNLSQASGDINPWFNRMLNKCPKGDDTPGEDHVQLDVPEIDDGLRNIYEKLNARETLKFDGELPRKANTYPYGFQFRHLNKRMQIFLEKTRGTQNLYDDRSETTSTSGSEKPSSWDFDDESPCPKKELEVYFNKMMRPKRDINFQPEDFKSWCMKMSFGYDRRFKDSDQMNITPQQEDFSCWLAKNSEKMNKRCNEEFSNTMKDLKQTRFVKRDIRRYRIQDCSDEDFPSDVSKCNWSTSNVSSCRSMAEKLL